MPRGEMAVGESVAHCRILTISARNPSGSRGRRNSPPEPHKLGDGPQPWEPRV